MAAQSRGADPSLEQLLFEEAYRFDFFQAVRLLERLFPERRPVGREVNPAPEVVRFRSHAALSFPPSAIHGISPAKDGEGPVQMTVAFMGVFGLLGVLPRHYTELLIERERHKDYALRDFLDLFNHRLISLFYRAWEKYRFPVAYERGVLGGEGPDRFSQYLFDFIGLGTQGLRGRLAVEDEAFLFYAGLLAQHPHSGSALVGLLSDYFMVPVEVVQCVGQWLALSATNRSRLGWRAGNSTLGVNTIAGSHVWDQQAKFRLRLGPLTYAQFCRFLPSGESFRPLVALTRWYAGQEFDFDLQLILRAPEVPPCRLGDAGPRGPRLGWSTWLKAAEFTHDADDAVLAGQLTYGVPAAG